MPRLIEKFLGAAEAAKGPFGLLGIEPARCDEATIVASLHARLARVSAHPQSRTPEADQVRLALHAAAAQLMDPVLRVQALTAMGAGTIDFDPSEMFDPFAGDDGDHGDPVHPGEADKPNIQAAPSKTSPAAEDIDQALRRDTRVLLGAFGGINPASHRRLTMLAHSKGVSQEQMQRVLESLAPAPHSNVQASLKDFVMPVQERPLTDQIDPGYLVLDKFIKFGLMFVLAISVMGGGIYLLMRKGGTAAPVAPPKAVQVSEAAPRVKEDPASLFASKPAPKTIDKAGPDIEKSAAALANLRKLAGTSGTDAKSLMAQLDEVGRKWFELAPDQSASLQDAMVEGMYRLDPAEASTVVDGLVARAGWMKDSGAVPSESQVSDAVLACGLLTRLSKEESFAPEIRRGLESSIAQVFDRGTRPDDRTFQGGAQAALNVAADRLQSRWTDPALAQSMPLGWRRWAQSAIAAGGSNRHRLVLLTLEGMLTFSPDPTQNRGVFDAIGELGGALDITGDAEVRMWILRWLVAPGIDSSHLFALTSRFADNPQKSAGIDHTLVVATSATERTRIELRERYAKVWGVGDLGESDKLRSSWLTIAKTQIAAPIGNGGTVERLGRLRNWGRLNDAASLLWAGNQTDASAAMDSVVTVEPIAQPITPLASFVVEFPSDDGMFGARYFSIPPADRHTFIGESLRDGEIGPRDAAIVVTEFIRSGTTNTRAALKDVIRRHSRDRFLLRALLDHSASFPRTREISEMIETIGGSKLPAPDELVWRIEVRRTLIEANLAQIASTKEFATLDLEAETLASGYWQRLGVQGNVTLTPDQVAFKLTERWRAQARVLIATGREPWTIDQLERKLGSRRAQARGIVQKFVAEQFGLAELLAYSICNESPGLTGEVKKLIGGAELEVAAQGSVLAQVELLEKTLMRLWMIRLQEQEGVPPA